MMKLSLVMLLLVALTGCASVHHVTPKQFQLQANLMQSFQWTEYIGQADGKVYLLRKSAPLFGKIWTEEILYTETGALSPAFLRQLQETKEKRASNKVPVDTTRPLADPQQ